MRTRADERPHWSEDAEGRQRWDLHSSTRDLLEQIEALEDQRRELDNRITALVMEARQDPPGWHYRRASWEQIGCALGISKQAANKRYDRKLV